MFDTVAKDVVLSALNGVNGTVFAYGSTGSGKTFTITGGVARYADRGLIPRAMSLAFATMAERSDWTYEVCLARPCPSCSSFSHKVFQRTSSTRQHYAVLWQCSPAFGDIASRGGGVQKRHPLMSVFQDARFEVGSWLWCAYEGSQLHDSD